MPLASRIAIEDSADARPSSDEQIRAFRNVDEGEESDTLRRSSLARIVPEHLRMWRNWQTR